MLTPETKIFFFVESVDGHSCCTTLHNGIASPFVVDKTEHGNCVLHSGQYETVLFRADLLFDTKRTDLGGGNVRIDLHKQIERIFAGF